MINVGRVTQKTLFLLIIVLFLGILLLLFDVSDWTTDDWTTDGHPTLEESKSKCRGEGRAVICEYTNFCVDSKRGAYIVNRNDISKPANVMNADESADGLWKPEVKSSYPWKVQYINETLFVYGLYSPFHFSHWMFNGLLPLYSVMRSYNATRDAWLLRVHMVNHQRHRTFPEDISFLTDGKDIVFNRADILTDMQVVPSTTSICFAKAVVGAGNRCSLNYCENNIPTEHYQQLRKDIFSYYIHNGQWERYIQQNHKDERELACLDTTKIYTPTFSNDTTVIIAILQRYHSRHILNADKLIDALVKQNYIVKFLNFDVGCSLPATAKLLEDVDILITPHGNGLGDGIFMAPKTTVISIDSRFYSEPWFAHIHTAAGRRFYNFQCDSSDCQVADFETAKNQLQVDGVEMSYYELMEYLGPEYPYRLIDKYYLGKGKWGYSGYAKEAMRRVDVEKLVKFVKEIVDEWPMVQKKSFVELCEMGKCCGPDCGVALKRNVFGKGNAWGGVERPIDAEAANWKAG
ncbi:1672_t:CDS:2 [Paraglomus brasilianum]|uniref:1672_t:CDS:1 n=1 Tax=Paraglomus brasilianum TaxID=144538 RepID=A0A9N9CL48_9GLOM|nr:1672_t:CDS:2 [Paraglomus brasilianum]